MNGLKSVGTLYSIQDLCEDLAKRSINKTEFLEGFQKKYSVSTSAATLSLATALNWVATSTDGLLVVTEKGKRAVLGNNRVEKLRNQLKSYILEEKPFWATRIFMGRKETLPFLSAEVEQCFEEAELMQGFDDTVTKWWDEVGSVFRNITDEKLLEIGRQGERESLKYEEKRTKVKPKWQAIDTNASGYDILSRVDEDNPTKLKIEVKASTRPYSDATIHITRNEWDVADISLTTYTFHIWLLSEQPPKLITASVDSVKKHIPMDNGCGSWESVEIPIGKII